VALITQSSNIALNLTMQARGLPLAYVMTVGNQAQTSMAEVAEALLEDDRVTALGLHIEGIGDIRAFEAMAGRARALGKRIVVIKAGASEQARTAALSHTGALAGSDAGARALLERLGIARVEHAERDAGNAEAPACRRAAGSHRIASMSCSGGEAGLMADAAVGHGRHVSALGPCAAKALRDALGGSCRAGQSAGLPHLRLGRPRRHRADLHRDDAGRPVHGRCGGRFSPPDRCDASAWDLVIDAVSDTMVATGRPMAILATLPETMPEDVAQTLVAQGIVPLCGVDDGLRRSRRPHGWGRSAPCRTGPGW
jgi:hypothetical protein